MARIFLSYAREDALQAASKLRKHLTIANHIVWQDIEDLPGGLPWRDQIRKQIETVHCIIVVLTPSALESANVEYEWRTALEFQKRVIPVMLIECAPVPEELAVLNYHIATAPNLYEQILMKLIRDISQIESEIIESKPAVLEVSDELVNFIHNAVRAYTRKLTDLIKLGVEHPPLEPYKELYAFELTDRQIFFGRETDSKRLQKKILIDRLAILHARSGAGKTSLLNAGLIPLLVSAGFVPIYARTHTDPIEAIKRAVTSALPYKVPAELQHISLHQFLRLAEIALGTEYRELVIIIDQFEEFFVLYPHFEQRLPFISAIADCYDDLTLRARFLLALRKDYFSDLDEFKERLPGIFINEYRLPVLTRDQAIAAIVEPVRMVDLVVDYEPNLLHELIRDLETSGMELPHLQIICNHLYSERDTSAKSITLKDYTEHGGAKGILGNYLTRTLDSLPSEERQLADDILFELVSSQNTKRILPRARLIASLRSTQSAIDSVLSKLINARLLRKDKGDGEDEILFEMAHEYLVDEIQRRASSNPQKVIAKRIQEFLQRGVIEWKTGSILMQDAVLERIFSERENLQDLTDDELLILILSCSQLNRTADLRYWLELDPEKSMSIIKHFVLSEDNPLLLRRRIMNALRVFENSALPLLIEIKSHFNESIVERSEEIISLISPETPTSKTERFQERLRRMEELENAQRVQREKERLRQIELEKLKRARKEEQERKFELQQPLVDEVEANKIKASWLEEKNQRLLEEKKARQQFEEQQERLKEQRRERRLALPTKINEAINTYRSSKSPNAESEEVLMKIRSAPTYKEAYRAIRLLCDKRHVDHVSIKAVLESLRHENEWVRLAAVETLADLRIYASLECVKMLYEIEPHTDVKSAARRAIETLEKHSR